jgi:hypothetical protein
MDQVVCGGPEFFSEILDQGSGESDSLRVVTGEGVTDVRIGTPARSMTVVARKERAACDDDVQQIRIAASDRLTRLATGMRALTSPEQWTGG